jgi:hypothetical protein
MRLPVDVLFAKREVRDCETRVVMAELLALRTEKSTTDGVLLRMPDDADHLNRTERISEMSVAILPATAVDSAEQPPRGSYRH